MFGRCAPASPGRWPSPWPLLTSAPGPGRARRHPGSHSPVPWALLRQCPRLLRAGGRRPVTGAAVGKRGGAAVGWPPSAMCAQVDLGDAATEYVCVCESDS